MSETKTTPDKETLLDIAVVAATEAGKLVHERINSDLQIKFKAEGAYNLVTAMDLASERLIKEIIGSRQKDAIFLAEESGGDEDLRPLTWVVDPIDGTVNYAHGIPIYCISIAAVMENEPVAGVIFDPSTGELFTATKGGGAFLNGKQLHVSDTTEITRSVLTTGFPYNVEENPFGCIDAFADFLRRGIPVRRLGSAALDLAYVAAGRFDGYWEVSLNAWDVAAGALLVTEAGGTIGSYAPEQPTTSIVTDRLLATNGKIADQMREVLQRP